MTLESITKAIYSVIISLSLLFNNAVVEANYFFNPPCAKPITYKIGQVDKQFNLTQDQFQKDIEEASQVWEQAIGRDLFTYSSEGTLTISLVFDERQLISNNINSLENNLSDQKQSLSPQVADYKKRAAALEKRVADLNAEIDKWNSQGGAPPEAYDRIKKEQADIQTEADSLNAQAKSLNQLSSDYNLTVDKLNKTIGSFNEEISLKPEEGIYDPNQKTITIYFGSEKNELVHTLAHELGHSLGINHNSNPKSIMYPKTTKSSAASTDDLTELNTVCRIKN